MNKYQLIGGSLFVAGALLWGVYAASDKTNEATVEQVNSAIEATQETFDFGDIDIFGGKVETIYEIQNTGTADVTIVSAVTSCMCTEGKIDDLTFGMHGQNGVVVVIPAGGTKALTAIFDPLAHGPEGTGPITRELTLKTNSKPTPEITVKFSGNVVKNSN